MPDKTTDKALMDSFKEGDHSAFHCILHKYESHVIRYLYSFTGDMELSKDICQETFMLLVNRPPIYLRDSSLKPWLFSVARNKLTDSIRKKMATKKIETEYHDITTQLSTIPNHDKRLEHSGDNIEIFVSSLPEIYREIVSLHVYGDMTFSEISKFLKIPLGTALWRMKKAISILRNKMEANNELR
jgi:RNA polymerase sigma-70 factor (ECF subfamily)